MSVSRNVTATLAAVIVAAGIVTTVAYFWLSRSIQPRSGDRDLEGLSASVDVLWDEWAIPTIVAETEADVFRTQGYVHAAERLWQLELFQRIARGRLAEIFGEDAVGTDRLVRTLDLWGAAAEGLARLPLEDRRLLDAYAEGVNARVATWRGPLPPEFLVLGIEPLPWSAQASLAIARIMSLDLSGWRGELNRFATLSRIPVSLHEEMMAEYPEWGPTVMQEPPDGGLPPATAATPMPSATASGPASHSTAAARPAMPVVPDSAGTGGGPDPLAILASFGLHASNSWAIGGSRTASGHPLLANDMHLSLRAPSTWFVNALHAEDDGLHVAGLSIPGAPGVVVGLNRSLAWGFTNAMVDDGDFIVESLNLDASMYRHEEEWRPFDIRTEQIAVRGGDTVRHEVRETVRGPIITDVVPSAGLTMSLLWTGLDRHGAASALFGMNRAGNADEFRTALAAFGSPHQNVIYATVEGELGYRLVGSIPRRDGADGSVPLPFERLESGWTGYLPPDSMPAAGHPPTDYLASANNLQARSLYRVVGTRYPLPFRARRIVDRVSEASEWTVADMVALQLDTHSLWAERLLPRAVAAARRIDRPDIVALLEGWDLDVTVDSREAVYFYVWLYRLRQRIAADELDGSGYFSDLALLRILERGESPWIDDTATPERESLGALEGEAMRTAAEVADGRTWGEVHRERSVHPLGAVSFLDRVFRFQVGPYPAPGGRYTVRPDAPLRWSAVDSTSWTPPFVSEYGPSERFVASLDPDDPVGWFFLPTGQAGNPLDDHYRDMAGDPWLDGVMAEVSLRLDPDEVAASRLRLNPGSDDR